jgi:hypothetical protein
MSIIRAIKHRLGLSVTPANNFVLDASADDGTMKLARESGQDIMTVAANGGVSLKGGTVAPADGMVGELLTNSGGPVNIGIALAVGNMAAITLTPGVWDVQVRGSFNPSAAGTSLINITGSLTAGALGSISTALFGGAVAAGVATTLTGFVSRQVVTANTTVTCTARAQGTSGTINCTGTITAWRVA